MTIKQRLQNHHQQQQQHNNNNRCNKNSNPNNNVDNDDNENDDSKNDNVVVDDDDDDVIKIRIPSYVNKTLMKLPCCCCSWSILKYIKDHMATCAASIIGLKLMCVLICFLVKIIIASTLVYYGVTNELFIHHNKPKTTTAATTTPLTIGIQQTRITTDPHNILLSPQQQSKQQQQQQPEEEEVVVEKPSLRILYILTSLSEYNNGLRNTIRGQDRLYEIVIPLLVDNVESMIMKPFYYDVDIYIITAYTLSKERYQYIRNRIPTKVNIYIWDDALPLGYDKPYKDNTQISNNTRALARQHRYVVKDNLDKYDFFLAFEDDMRITGYHIEHYMAMENAIQILRDNAPTELLPNDDEMSEQVSMDSTEPYKQDPYQQRFYGTLTKRQFDRIIPGFIRVEVNLHPNKRNTQQTLDPIPRDYSFSIPSSLLSSNDYINNSTTTTSTSTSTSSFNSHFDPYYCCNVENMSPNVQNIPINPDMEDVLIWETSIKALTVRKMPTTQQQQQQQSSTSSSSSSLSSLSLMNELLDWVVLLPGTGKRLSLDDWIGGYWSGRKHQFGIDSTKPSSGEPSLIAQQGGWMLTREQIQRINNLKLCQGSFLPPFNEPIYKNDGLESNNVEYWSGGYHLYTGVLGGCNMQRIMSTHPIHISKHFIYHIANNKQKQLSQQRLIRVDDLYGQINTIRKLAIEDMNNIINTTTTTTNNNNINNNDGTTTTEKKKRKKNKMMMKKKKK